MNIYKIGVSLAMTSNASQVLGAIATQLIGIHGHIGRVTAGWNRMTVAIVGGAGVIAGAGLLHGLLKITEAGKDLSHELTQVKKLGVDLDTFNAVRQKAVDVTRAVPGVTQSDALKGFGQAYSIFGADNAIKLMEPLQRFSQVLGNTSGDYEKAADSLYNMIRAGDLLGKFVDEKTHSVSIDKLQHFLDLGSKVTLATHGTVGPDTWLGLAQQGGAALSGMSDQGLLTMAIAAQAMGGTRAGTALTSMYQQMVGGKMTKQVARNLQRLGLVGGFTTGKGLQWNKGALDTPFSKQLREDPILAVQTMKAALQAHGKTTIEDQVPELFKILGRQTTQRLVHDLLRNLPQILGERERTAGAMSIGESAKTADAEDVSKSLHNMHAAWQDLLQTLGNSKAAIEILDRLTSALKSMTAAVQSWPPGRLELIANGLVALGAVMVGGGIAALGIALGPVALGLGALAGVATALALVDWKSVGATISTAMSEVASEFKKSIMEIPAAIGPAISAAMSAVGSAIGNALKGILGHLNSGGGIANPIGYRGPGPAPRNRPVQVHTAIHLDGARVATAVTRHQIAGMNGPARGSEYVDFTSTFPQIA